MSKISSIWLLCGQSYITGECNMNLLDASRQGNLFHERVYAGGTTFQVINSTLNNNQYNVPSNQYGPEFELADIATFLNKDIYILKYAIGGTYLASIAQGAPTISQNWNVNTVGDLYNDIKTYVTNVKTFMTNRGKTARFEGVIWGQGGADANNVALAQLWQQNMEDFASGLGTHIGQTGLKWYIMQEHPSLNTRPGWTTVVAAQQAFVAADTTKRRIINIDDVTVQPSLHPDAPGNITLGQHFVTAIKADF